VTAQTGGGNIPDKLMPWLNQEILHAQWAIILGDKELQRAIKNGFVQACPDKVERRFYIRIFTYSADYPEKRVVICHLCGLNLTYAILGCSYLQ
jgi:hypothetical protein